MHEKTSCAPHLPLAELSLMPPGSRLGIDGSGPRSRLEMSAAAKLPMPRMENVASLLSFMDRAPKKLLLKDKYRKCYARPPFHHADGLPSAHFPKKSSVTYASGETPSAGWSLALPSSCKPNLPSNAVISTVSSNSRPLGHRWGGNYIRNMHQVLGAERARKTKVDETDLNLRRAEGETWEIWINRWALKLDCITRERQTIGRGPIPGMPSLA